VFFSYYPYNTLINIILLITRIIPNECDGKGISIPFEFEEK